MEVEVVEAGLFADLKSEQRLVQFKDLTAQRLLQRYNVALAQAVLLESALSYLGAGPQRPFATWGRIISDGQDYITTSWWLVTLPGLVIVLMVVGVKLLGDGMRDALDPRLARRM